MNTQGYLDWPFRPDHRSDEQEAQWWRTCYLPTATDHQLAGAAHWFVLAGPPGSGKSVALAAWLARRAESLLLQYPPELWPGSPKAWHPSDPTHLRQMLAVAGNYIAEVVQRDPALAEGLDRFQREFLRALLEQQGGARRYQRFVLGLPPPLRPVYQETKAEVDFFDDTNSLIGVQGIIQELVLLANALGRQRIVFLVDPVEPLGHAHLVGLGNLLGWLDLTDNPDLAVVVALREALLHDSPLLARARSRISLIYTHWTEAECRRVAACHMQQALPDAAADQPLSAYLTEEVIEMAGRMLVAEYGDANPSGWVLLAETVLFAVYRADTPLAAPIAAADFGALRKLFFTRHIKLRLDPAGHRVWRGARSLAIDDQPLRLLTLLHQRQRRVNWDDLELRELAGSPSNLYSIASRARKAIEPDPDDPVFLLNKRGIEGGYWLENCP